MPKDPRTLLDPGATLPVMDTDALWEAARADLLARATGGEETRKATPGPLGTPPPTSRLPAPGAMKPGVMDPTVATADFPTPAPAKPFGFPDWTRETAQVPVPRRSHAPRRLMAVAGVLLALAVALAAFLLR